jgi:hypothetical protein
MIAFDCHTTHHATCRNVGKHSAATQRLYIALGWLPSQNDLVRQDYVVKLCQWQVDNAAILRWSNIRSADHLCPQCGEEHS